MASAKEEYLFEKSFSSDLTSDENQRLKAINKNIVVKI